MSSDFTLSRRKALAGIGGIGVASAGAGLGTSAYYSDQGEFDGNSIQAGEFGLSVEQSVRGVDQDGLGPDEDEWDQNKDEDGIWVTSPIEIADAKPGDEFEFCWDITVSDNPGLVKVVASNTSDQTGVEAENVTLADLWDIDTKDQLSTIGEEATASVDIHYPDGTQEGFDYLKLTTLINELAGDGLPINGGVGDTCLGAGETVTFCITVLIPSGVGNEIQGAVTGADLTVYGEQCRHNDASEFANRTVTT